MSIKYKYSSRVRIPLSISDINRHYIIYGDQLFKPSIFDVLLYCKISLDDHYMKYWIIYEVDFNDFTNKIISIKSVCKAEIIIEMERYKKLINLR